MCRLYARPLSCRSTCWRSWTTSCRRPRAAPPAAHQARARPPRARDRRACRARSPRPSRASWARGCSCASARKLPRRRALRARWAPDRRAHRGRLRLLQRLHARVRTRRAHVRARGAHPCRDPLGEARPAPFWALFQPSEEAHPLGAEMIVERACSRASARSSPRTCTRGSRGARSEPTRGPSTRPRTRSVPHHRTAGPRRLSAPGARPDPRDGRGHRRPAQPGRPAHRSAASCRRQRRRRACRRGRQRDPALRRARATLRTLDDGDGSRCARLRAR